MKMENNNNNNESKPDIFVPNDLVRKLFKQVENNKFDLKITTEEKLAQSRIRGHEKRLTKLLSRRSVVQTCHINETVQLVQLEPTEATDEVREKEYEDDEDEDEKCEYSREQDTDSDYDGEDDYPDEDESPAWTSKEERSLAETDTLALIMLRLQQLTEIDKGKDGRSKAKSVCISGASVFVESCTVAFVGSDKNWNKQTFLVDIYNNKIWRGPSLPVCLFNAASVHIGNGDVFVCGGYIRGHTVVNGNLVKEGFSNRCWIINVHSGRRVECPPMKAPRSSHQAVYFAPEKKIIVMGGVIDENTETDTIEYFDLMGNKWCTTVDKLSCPRYNFTATLDVQRSMVVVVGGATTGDEMCGFPEVFDIKGRKSLVCSETVYAIDHSAFMSKELELRIIGGTGRRVFNGTKTADIRFDMQQPKTYKSTNTHDVKDQVIAYRPHCWLAIKHKSLLVFEKNGTPSIYCYLFRNIRTRANLFI
jgi:hypothetical protein